MTPQFHSWTCTDRGRVRRVNEDSLLAQPEVGLWLVADGMGGHGAGDVASQAIVEGVRSRAGEDAIAERLARVNHALEEVQLGLQRRADPGAVMGSTLAFLLLDGRDYIVGWAGDSRVYRLPAQGQFECLTHDHSVVQEMLDNGSITAGEAARHPLRNQITRALGSNMPLDVESRRGAYDARDLFVLCTDGLTTHLDDKAIAQQVQTVAPHALAASLVEAAVAAGGRDNVSVIVVTSAPA